MASSWIKIEVITPDKPEVYQIAEILEIDPDSAMGKLVRLWAWADQQTIDGNAKCNAPSVTKSAIDRITFVNGFADALINVGWLVFDKNALVFHNFERHNGNSSKKRALTNSRVTKLREMKRKGNADNVTDTYQKALPEEEEEREKERKDSKNILSHGEKIAKRPNENFSGSEKTCEVKLTQPYPVNFEVAWKEYPKRAGGADKLGAFKSWQARVREGVDPDVILAGVKRYAAYLKATGKVGTEFVKQAKTFFGPSCHYDDGWEIPQSGIEGNTRNINQISQPDNTIPPGFRG